MFGKLVKKLTAHAPKKPNPKAIRALVSQQTTPLGRAPGKFFGQQLSPPKHPSNRPAIHGLPDPVRGGSVVYVEGTTPRYRPTSSLKKTR